MQIIISELIFLIFILFYTAVLYGSGITAYGQNQNVGILKAVVLLAQLCLQLSLSLVKSRFYC